MISLERVVSANEKARRDLLSKRTDQGHWVGQLAASALSTATAVSALSLFQRHSTGFETNAPCDFDVSADFKSPKDRDSKSPISSNAIANLIENGLLWLAEQQNPDGGWGDTDQSYSNISTTMLVSAAFHLTAIPAESRGMLERAAAYVESQGGVRGLRKRYGRDKTFAVPILANCALAGQIPWSQVSSLPFELACFPQSFYRFLRLPVVSYAIPALVAIGQAKFYHRKPWNPVTRLIRGAATERSLKVLLRIQPASGGYLEAIPLTSFVAMSLASVGRCSHPVVQNGIRFICDTVLKDGSWPIDTNLATWNTTLSINALAGNGSEPKGDRATSDISAPTNRIAAREIEDCLDWVLSCQNKDRHPFTGANPGGWGWSDLSGAVPDADDTPGALLALRNFFDSERFNTSDRLRIQNAITLGIEWLLDLQNRDGGWPTFCRGWGKLPFDRSGTDLTAHVIRALLAWKSELLDLQIERRRIEGTRIETAIARGFQYLEKKQRDDGAWIPLWFGNQDYENEENPIYGTSKVILAYRDSRRLDDLAATKAREWLISNQNVDGGWGGSLCRNMRPSVDSPQQEPASSSVEETALALEGILSWHGNECKKTIATIRAGIEWLVEAVENDGHRIPSPIGFYFAKLWYYEELYPMIFAASALGAAVRQLAIKQEPNMAIQVN